MSEEDDALLDAVSKAEPVMGPISELVGEFLARQAQAEDLEAQLRDTQLRLREIQTRHLPEAMLAAGLSSVKHESGVGIEITSFTDCTITKEQRGLAHQWLVDNGYGGLISTVFSVKVPKGQQQTAEAVAQQLDDAGIPYDADERVHPSTLKSWAKERVQEAAQQGREFVVPPSIKLFTGMLAKIVK